MITRVLTMTTAAFLGIASASAEILTVPLEDWRVPFEQIRRAASVPDPLRPAGSLRRATDAAVPSGASHFITVVPCRVADTRIAAGAFGSPMLGSGETRTYAVPSGPCPGIPANASAYSLNFTVLDPVDNGFLTAYPTDSIRPTTATLSYLAGGPAFNNAAIVPAGTFGAIDVYALAQLHLIIDINGYFVEGVVTNVATSGGLTGGGTGNVTLALAPAEITRAHIAPREVVLFAPTTAQVASSERPVINLERDFTGSFMRLRSNGQCLAPVCWSTAPYNVLELHREGGFVIRSWIGTGFNPASGAGDRLMWHPRFGAFRAGGVTGAAWDDGAIGYYSMALGYDGQASGFAATAFGDSTLASGSAAVAAGEDTAACSSSSIALGYAASSSSAPTTTDRCGGTDHYGAFLFGDRSTTALLASTAHNQFSVRAAGGVRLFTNSSLTAGCSLSPGSGTWACTSDRNEKEAFTPLDGESVLEKLRHLPIESWSFRSEPGVRRAGPTAQDFRAAFGLGSDDRTIGHSDAVGIALKGVQALAERAATLSEENADLRERVLALEKLVSTLTGN